MAFFFILNFGWCNTSVSMCSKMAVYILQELSFFYLFLSQLLI